VQSVEAQPLLSIVVRLYQEPLSSKVLRQAVENVETVVA